MKYRLRSFVVYGTLLLGAIVVLQRLVPDPVGASIETSLRPTGAPAAPLWPGGTDPLRAYSPDETRKWDRYKVESERTILDVGRGEQDTITIHAPVSRSIRAPLLCLFSDRASESSTARMAAAWASEGGIVVTFAAMSDILERYSDGCLTTKSAARLSRSFHSLTTRIGSLLREHLPSASAPDTDHIGVAGVRRGAGCALVLAGKRMQAERDEFVRYQNPAVKALVLIDAPVLCPEHDRVEFDSGLSLPCLDIETDAAELSAARGGFSGTGGPRLVSNGPHYRFTLTSEFRTSESESPTAERLSLVTATFWGTHLQAHTDDKQLRSMIDSLKQASH